MKNYIWLNPVVVSSYDNKKIIDLLRAIDYEIVYPHNDYLKVVKEKYQALLKQDYSLPILDQRCPMIYDYFKQSDYQVIYHDIDPILIHTAKELADRSDLKDGYKWIITPCSSLKKMGNELNLENTIFLTWDEFIQYHNLEIEGHSLTDSPIPFGFFDELEKYIIYVDDHNINQLNLKDIRLIEGLYCGGGCHNGDGVKCLKTRK